MTPGEQAVIDLIDSDDVTTLTAALVAARGENPGGTEAATVDVLMQACSERGFEVQRWDVAPGRPNFVATLPGADGPGLMFLGHSDVVPAGDGWDGDPFLTRIENGRIIGRGVADMKGGLAAIIVAMAALRRSGAALSGPVSLVVTADEEDLDTGVRELITHGADYRGKYWGCVVAEPTQMNVVYACRGDAYLELEVTGVAAHSGNPAGGRNAIDAAAQITQVIAADHARLLAGADDGLGSGTWNVGRIEGGKGTSTVAPSCHVWVDRRLMPGEDPHKLLADLLAAVDDAGITQDRLGVQGTVTMEMPGFQTDPQAPIVTACAAAAQTVGYDGELEVWTAACDGGFVSRDFGIEPAVFGPGSVTGQAHQPNESVAVDELVAAAKAYALIALRGASAGRTDR